MGRQVQLSLPGVSYRFAIQEHERRSVIDTVLVGLENPTIRQNQAAITRSACVLSLAEATAGSVYTRPRALTSGADSRVALSSVSVLP